MIVLKNEYLEAHIDPQGAELKSLVRDGKERLWCGDSAYWGRVAPVLFPIVGRLKENTYHHNGQDYAMNQHGFARDRAFTVEAHNENKATFSLTWNEETLKVYPFQFKLVITYRLEKSRIFVGWHVENQGEEEMYFSIGAHPAFALEDEMTYHLHYQGQESVEFYAIGEDGLIHEQTSIENPQVITVEPSYFKHDAVVYGGIDEVCLENQQTNEKVTMTFKGFPYVGIWSPYKPTNEMAPFVCIEPWFGIADDVNTNQELKNKRGIHMLGKQQCFDSEYAIEIQ